MPDEFSYTFRRHSIVLTRDREDANWYIRVRGPDGLHKYDGYWRDSAGKPLKDALYEAKVGAQLIRPAPQMDPEAARNAGVAPAATSTDAAWVKRIRETAQHLRENSLRLAKYPGMGDEARARELAALYIEEIAGLHEAQAALGVPASGSQVKPPADADATKDQA